MLLTDKRSGDLVRVDDLDALLNPFTTEVMARDQAGEEEQDWAAFAKTQLAFPSGEELPKSWTDPDYRKGMRRQAKQAGHQA